MTGNPNDLQRFTAWERGNHWLVAICFILLALSGLALFHPALWPLTQLFGGGVWLRILHPFVGILIAVLFVSMFARFRALNLMSGSDWEWLKHVPEMVGSGGPMPPQGKFNGGQKLLFWALGICLLLLLLSGLVMWRAYFHPPAALARIASLTHAASGAVMIGLIIVHIYAAIWTPGALRAMLYGTVSRAWAKHHHELWFNQMTGSRP